MEEKTETSTAVSDLAGATQRAGLAIRELQTRLTGRATAEPASEEDLEKQLQHYFNRNATAENNAESSVVKVLRDKVVDGVVDRILREWQHPGGNDESALQREVMDRLIDRILNQMASGSR